VVGWIPRVPCLRPFLAGSSVIPSFFNFGIWCSRPTKLEYGRGKVTVGEGVCVVRWERIPRAAPWGGWVSARVVDHPARGRAAGRVHGRLVKKLTASIGVAWSLVTFLGALACCSCSRSSVSRRGAAREAFPGTWLHSRKPGARKTLGSSNNADRPPSAFLASSSRAAPGAGCPESPAVPVGPLVGSAKSACFSVPRVIAGPHRLVTSTADLPSSRRASTLYNDAHGVTKNHRCFRQAKQLQAGVPRPRKRTWPFT